MKRIGLALAAGFGAVLVAATPVTADDPTPAAAPVVVAAPTTATPVYSSDVVPATPARRGLFGRLRNRGTTTATPATFPAPVTGGTIITTPTPATTVPTPATTVPSPLPAKPAAGGTVSVAPMPTVVPASGTTPMPMTGVTTAGYTTMPDSTAQPTRRGLIARLRARR
jgi:hypothetical protein